MRVFALAPFWVLFASGYLSAAEPDASDQYYKAIRNDDSAAVARLLESAGPNVKDSRGGTPLMYATAFGSETMMRRLIDAGADVNAKNAFEATALLWCGANLPRIKILVEHGADVNVRSKMGHTPIFVAAAEAGGSPAVQYLLSKGATPLGPPDPAGMTAFAAAAAANETATLRILLEKAGKPFSTRPAAPGL